jgi:hypothetical protein
VNIEEYQSRQIAINAIIAQIVLQAASYFLEPRLPFSRWIELLRLLFPSVQELRSETARNARAFYDNERGYHTELDRHDRDLENTGFAQFVQSMEPARQKMSVANSPNDAVTRLQLQVIREVENAGRRQIIRAVAEDQAVHEEVVQRRTATRFDRGPRIVRGWARVATGRETCAWCLMLISRGPVYLAADRAGLIDLTDLQAEELYAKTAPDLDKFGEEVNDYMDEWHPGCDCLVVPVYNTEDWPGLAAQQRADELWVQATREAKALREKEERVHRTGKNAGQEITLGEDTVLALRRMIDRGDINFNQLAFAA